MVFRGGGLDVVASLVWITLIGRGESYLHKAVGQ